MTKMINFINWKLAKRVNVTQEEYANILEYYQRKGIAASSNTDFEEWTQAPMCAYKEKNTELKFRQLFTYSLSFNYKNYKNAFVIYCTNKYDDKKNTGTIKNVGLNSAIAVESHFRERTGMSLYKAFGTSPVTIKRCVPRQLAYNVKTRNLYEHVCSVDFSSHYPASCCGFLPDFHKNATLEYDGTVEPNEEYPFAFYTVSGHSAQYGVYDTHTWMDSKFNVWLFDGKQRPTILPECDHTILCKASKQELTDEMQFFYGKRKTDLTAKNVMNTFIGFMHKVNYTSFRYAHIAAVAIARANQKMIDLCEDIGKDLILQICVDGVIYKGKYQIGDDHKSLGALVQEYVDARIYYRGMNNYIVQKDGRFIKVAHAGYNAWDDGTPINDETLLTQIKDIQDSDHWKKIDYLR